MAIVFTNQGKQIALQNLFNKVAPQDLVVKLFENNYTILESSTEAAVTEATFSGYASQTMTPASVTITSADPAVASYAQMTFTSNAAQTKNVYGYYVVQATSGKMLWGENFGVAVPMNTNGSTCKVTIQLTLDTA